MYVFFECLPLDSLDDAFHGCRAVLSAALPLPFILTTSPASFKKADIMDMFVQKSASWKWMELDLCRKQTSTPATSLKNQSRML